MTPLTCISGGPFVGVGTGGKCLVTEGEGLMGDPMVAAFMANADCGQMVLAYPTLGITRDLRKATVEQVCAALTREEKQFVVGKRKEAA